MRRWAVWAIAADLDRIPSTISRERRSNCESGGGNRAREGLSPRLTAEADGPGYEGGVAGQHREGAGEEILTGTAHRLAACGVAR